MLLETVPPTLISEGSRVEGSLTFYSRTQVFGVVEGEILQETLDPLQVGRTGWVHGDIRSQGPVTIEGQIEGRIESKIQIRLMPTANVKGTLKAPRIEIRAGAQIEGKIQTRSLVSASIITKEAA